MSNIIKWAKEQYNKVIVSNDQQYKDAIIEYQRIIKQHEQLNLTLNEQLKTKDLVIATCQSEISDLRVEINNIKNSENIYPEPVIPVDFSRFPYFPTTKFYYYDKQTKNFKENSIQVTPGKMYRLWSDEMYSIAQSCYKRNKDKSFKDKLKALRNLVLDRCEYHSDLSTTGGLIENWKLPIQTFADKKGDCEDLTILWLTYCNICGIPSNRVFNLTGYYKTTGHSFGAYIDDDGLVYIMECTSKSEPIKFIGSDYRCKGAIKGLSNWQFSGVPGKEQF